MTTQGQTIPVGYKQTEVGVIPTDWDVKKMGEVGSFYYGKSAPKHSLSPTAKTPCVRYGELYTKFNGVVDKIYSYTKIPEEKLRFSTGGEILIPRVGEDPLDFCKCSFLPMKGIAIGEMISVYNTNQFQPFIVAYIRHKLKYQFADLVEGGNVSNLYFRYLKEVKIPFPALAEQTRIATVLSDIDELITQMDELIAKKKAIKQGALQSLLTPKKDWEVKKLGEVCDIKKGQLITESTRIDGDIPVIAGGKTPAYYHNKPNRFGKTITISGSGASAGYVAFHDYPIFASDCSTIEESNKYSVEFIHCTLQLLQEKIYKMQTGGAQPHIYPSDLNPIEIGIPKSKDEQTHIATILSDIDNEIQQLEQKKSKYEQIKQGAMQQLLTGKIRLK